MKKIIAAALLTLAIAGTSFAQGLTQMELAELLVNKAKAENLIEKKEYTEDEIVSLVRKYELMEITDTSAEMKIASTREILADYETKKLSIESLETEVDDRPITNEVVNESRFDREMRELLKKDRKLSHEFMEEWGSPKSDFSENRSNLSGVGEVMNKSFTYHNGIGDDYKRYPLIDKYRYEAFRILGWYALEYDLYVKQTPASVALYTNRGGVSSGATPLIEIGFREDGIIYDGHDEFYNAVIKVRSLYYVPWLASHTVESYRVDLAATNYEQAHFVMALNDLAGVLIKEEVILNQFVKIVISDVEENRNKEYDYYKKRFEIIDEMNWFITKMTGKVTYQINYDLTKWED